jgi:sec-independent protein translocase protein TatB
MFDIGFWELSLISIVALLVIGPERLPAVARTVGKWVGRANRFVSSVKDDINKELKDEDLKRILAEQQKLADEYKKAANEMTSSINSGTQSLKESAHIDDLLEIDEPEAKPQAPKEPQQSAKTATVTSSTQKPQHKNKAVSNTEAKLAENDSAASKAE